MGDIFCTNIEYLAWFKLKKTGRGIILEPKVSFGTHNFIKGLVIIVLWCDIKREREREIRTQWLDGKFIKGLSLIKLGAKEERWRRDKLVTTRANRCKYR
jgi:hypothetical protein